MFEGQINSQTSVRDFVILESRDFFLYFFVLLAISSDFFRVIFSKFSVICDFCAFLYAIFL